MKEDKYINNLEKNINNILNIHQKKKIIKILKLYQILNIIQILKIYNNLINNYLIQLMNLMKLMVYQMNNNQLYQIIKHLINPKYQIKEKII